jgi:hypothetical protein
MPRSDGACYACERPAVTVEHFPPRSFFPEGQRNQLLTVPSCERHNNDNSKDVEYVRNVLTTLWGANESGLSLFGDKVKRSFDRSPKLWTATFSSMQTIFYEGQITGAYKLDIKRLANVFEACARAAYYHEKQRKHTDWGITMPRLMFSDGVSNLGRQSWFRLLEMLRQIGFKERSVANPQVFEYGAAEIDGHSLYCFFLYQSFLVYALPLPVGAKAPITVIEEKANR